MKILVITLHADPTINPGAEGGGGTHLYINEIINLFIYKQVDALFITRKASKGKDYFKYGNVKIKGISLGPENYWDKNNFDNRGIEIQDIILNELQTLDFHPDLIHSIYWHSGRAAMYFSKIFKIPFIHTIISNGIRKKTSGYNVSNYRIRTEKSIYNKADILISITKQEKDDLENYYNISAEKIKVIGRGVDNIFLKTLYDKNGVLLAKDEPNINTI
jgi:D-inositol-3-phosphate glycosyltransferase